MSVLTLNSGNRSREESEESEEESGQEDSSEYTSGSYYSEDNRNSYVD